MDPQHLARGEPVLIAEELREIADPASGALVGRAVGERRAEHPALT
jgi:hypothetical protein